MQELGGWMDVSVKNFIHSKHQSDVKYVEGRERCPHSICLLVFYYSYYMDGRIRKVEDFLKTRLLDTLTEQLSKVTKVPDYHTPA